MAEMNEESRGQKRKIEETSYDDRFITPGYFDNEVKLKFLDDNLYVSKNLLKCASPVFKSMFEHGFKEEEENEVNITDCTRDDFLEFLQHIDPGTMKQIDEKNPKNMDILRISDKYGCSALIERFKENMRQQLGSFSENDSNSLGYNRSDLFNQVRHALACLHILQIAIDITYEDIKTMAIKALARCAPRIYLGEAWMKDVPLRCNKCTVAQYDQTCRNCPMKPSDENLDLQKKCRKIFSEFQDEIKVEICKKRNELYPTDKYIKARVY